MNATVELVRGSQTVARALLAGEVDFANIAAPAVIRANLAGGDLTYLTGGANRLVQSIIGSPRLSSLEDLRGRKLGMGAPGDIQDYVVRYLLASHGLELGRDIARVQVEDQRAALDQLDSGDIDAAVFSPPHEFEARKRGFVTLVDLKDSPVEYQLGGVLARRSLIDAQPDLVEKVVRAYVRGVHVFKSRPEAVVRVLRDFSRVEDAEVARQTYEAYYEIFQRVPLPTVAGLERIMRGMPDIPAELGPALAATTADTRWVQRLADSGFIDRLYSGA